MKKIITPKKRETKQKKHRHELYNCERIEFLAYTTACKTITSPFLSLSEALDPLEKCESGDPCRPTENLR